MPAPLLTRIDHVGLAVPDLDAAIAFYERTFGMAVLHEEVNEEQGVREAMLSVDGGVDGSADGGGPCLQLLAPLRADSPIARFLERNGEGVQQVAYAVEDIDAVCTTLRDRGLRLLYDEPRRGTAGSRINFVHPKDAGGVLVELVEAAAVSSRPGSGYGVGMTDRHDGTPTPSGPRGADLPPYAGSGDTGVRASGGAATGTGGDAVDLLRAEHARIEGILDELSGHLGEGDLERAQLRFGGLVRQVLELQAAEAHVVWPAVEDHAAEHHAAENHAGEDDGLRGLRDRGADLRARLSAFDELNASPSPDELRAVGEQLRGYVRAEGEELVPVLAALPAEERARLGEDLRQVMG